MMEVMVVAAAERTSPVAKQGHGLFLGQLVTPCSEGPQRSMWAAVPRGEDRRSRGSSILCSTQKMGASTNNGKKGW
jgi:hypothetical protein